MPIVYKITAKFLKWLYQFYITPVFQILQLVDAVSSINRDVLSVPDVKF